MRNIYTHTFKFSFLSTIRLVYFLNVNWFGLENENVKIGSFLTVSVFDSHSVAP